jgi:hypothetical protein
MGTVLSCYTSDGSVDDGELKQQLLRQYQGKNIKRSVRAQVRRIPEQSQCLGRTPSLQSFQRTAMLATRLDCGRISREEYHILMNMDGLFI